MPLTLNESLNPVAALEDLKDTQAALVEALEAIKGLAGNLPDEQLETATGPNDARYRGGMVVSAREIARTALKLARGE